MAALVDRDGERVTLARLGISRQTLARCLGGLGLYPGTHALIRQRLDVLDSERCRTAAGCDEWPHECRECPAGDTSPSK